MSASRSKCPQKESHPNSHTKAVEKVQFATRFSRHPVDQPHRPKAVETVHRMFLVRSTNPQQSHTPWLSFVFLIAASSPECSNISRTPPGENWLGRSQDIGRKSPSTPNVCFWQFGQTWRPQPPQNPNQSWPWETGQAYIAFMTMLVGFGRTVQFEPGLASIPSGRALDPPSPRAPEPEGPGPGDPGTCFHPWHQRPKLGLDSHSTKEKNDRATRERDNTLPPMKHE